MTPTSVMAPVVATATVIALSYTPVEITTLTVALAAVIAAFFTGVAQVITAVRTTKRLDETAKKLDQNTLVAQEVKAAVGVVAGHVNSAATASVAKIEALQREVAEMRVQLADQRQIAALLAQTKAVDDADKKDPLP